MLAQTGDGAQIYYEVYDFTDPWSESETIILHHGLRGNHAQWYRWIPELSRHYRTVVLDARGRGQSTIPPEEYQWNLEQFATDDLAVLDAVGVEKAHFIGASFGSAVGEYLGARYPERLTTLTLVSAPYRFDHLAHVIHGWIDDMNRVGTLEFLRRDVRNMYPEGADPAMLEWEAQQLARVPDHVARSLLPFLATVNLDELLPQIAVPTLLLAAAHSDRAPASESVYMRERIPNAMLVTLEGHHNIAMTQPEECTRVILGFLHEHGIT